MSIALSCKKKKFLKVYNCKQEMHTKINEDEYISKYWFYILIILTKYI